MSADVLHFPGSESIGLDIEPRNQNLDAECVAMGAVERADSLTQLICLGLTDEGDIYAATTHANVADTVLLLDRFRQKLMRTFEDDEFSDD